MSDRRPQDCNKCNRVRHKRKSDIKIDKANSESHPKHRLKLDLIEAARRPSFRDSIDAVDYD